MKQKVGRLRLVLLTLLAITVCATAIAFIGVNYGDSLKVSAATSVKTEVGEVFLDENGYRILDKKDYFNYNTNTANGTITITGLSEKGYKALDAFPYKGGFIQHDFAIVLPGNTEEIAVSAFDYTPTLRKITFNDGLKAIKSYAFRFTGVKEIEIPASITTFDCSTLAGVNLENISVRPVAGVTDPAIDATADGTALVSLKTILSPTYAANTVLQTTTDVDLPALFNGVELQNTSGTFKAKSLAGAIFSLKELDTLTIPAGLTSLTSVFWFTNIHTINVESGNTVFTVENNVLLDKATKKTVYFAAGENIYIPDDVISLPGGWCNGGAKSISLPDTVTAINITSGGSTKNLETITMRGAGKNATFGVVDNCLIQYGTGANAGKDTLLMGCANSVIPASVTSIATQAFYYNGNITRVTSDPAEIASGNNNGNGYTLYIPETVKTMGNAVFEFGAVESVDLHSCLTTIYGNTFNACPIFFNPDNWDRGAVNYAGSYLMIASQTLSGTYEVREGTSVLAASSFKLALNVQVLKLPETVVNINTDSLSNCVSLTTLYLPSSLETVSTGFHANTLLIAPSMSAYNSYKTGILSRWANQLTYQIPTTFKVVGETVETYLLAGKPFSYGLNETTGEWVNDEIFSVGGFFVNKWKDDNDATGTAKEINAGDIVPNNVESLSYTAYSDDGSKELEEITTLEKVKLENTELIYGEIYELPAGYNEKYMSIRYEGTSLAGDAYSEVVPPVNAGTYTIIITPNQGYKWHDGSIGDLTATLTINRAYVEDLTWYDLNVSYDGREHTPYATFVDEFTGKVVTLISQPHTDAGEYTVTVSVAATSNYYIPAYVTNTSETMTITPHEIDINWVGPVGFVYLADTDNHAPDATILGYIDDFDNLINGKYTVKVYERTDTSFSTPLTEVKTKGEYVMVITLDNDGTYGNFIFKDSDTPFVATCEFDLIDTLIIHVFWENYKEQWEYDGRDHTPKAYYVSGNSSEKIYLDVTLSDTEAIKAGNYTASLNILSVLPADVKTLLDDTHGLIYGYNDEVIYGWEDDGSGGYTEIGKHGIDTVTFEIVKLEVAIGWLNDHETFAYDGFAHNPVAYYMEGDTAFLLEITIYKDSVADANAVAESIETGKYIVKITDEIIANLAVDSTDVERAYEIINYRTTVSVTVSWTATTTFVYNGEEQSPVASIMSLDGNEVIATASSVYTTASGTVLSGAPKNVGKYKVMTAFYDEDGVLLAEADYDYEIVKAQVVKPVVSVSVFATVEAAKAYAPVGYDANTMVICGNEGDGVYTLTIGLKDTDNYEWADGKTDAESYTLKISPNGASLANNTTLYAIIGGIGLLALIAVIALAVIALIAGRRKAAAEGNSDDDGFYETFEEE